MSLSIHGIFPGGQSPTPAGGDGRLRPSGEPRGGRASSGGVRGSDPEAAAGVPEGLNVDPRLWEMLTGEERAFYLRHALSGPLTYAPATSASASAATGRRMGGRIDVRG
jgi:hypothetical protein